MTGDAPFHLYHIGKAAVASVSLSGAYIRMGYDIPLPLRRQWPRKTPPHSVDIHRPRKWLVSFRGAYQNNGSPYYEQRLMAARSWENASDVLVDLRRFTRVPFPLSLWKQTYTWEDYRYPDSIYDDIIWNSTFGFAPGGSGVGSFRFSEVLSTGGIPVVSGDFVPPMAPEVDWSGCLVYVSESQISDIPQRLREMTEDDVYRRQQECWRLSGSIIGEEERDGEWYGSDATRLGTALQIWAARISNAFSMRQKTQAILG